MTILVTGAAGGIGGAILELALERGHDVVAHDLRADALPAGGTVATVGGDLLDPATRRALAERLDGVTLDAVIAAHGIPGDGALTALDDRRVRSIMDVNAATIPALYAATEHALGAGGGGSFVAVASQASLRGERDNAAYCASKWAVTGWVRAIAGPALRDHGVRVRALCPGRTESPLLESAMAGFAAARGATPQAYLDEILGAIPLHRFARARETAAAALYLAATADRPTVLAASGGEVPY